MTKIESIIYALGELSTDTKSEEDVRRIELNKIDNRFREGYKLARVGNSSRISLYDSRKLHCEQIVIVPMDLHDPHNMACIFLLAYDMYAKKHKKE
jgi:hypothetical protein